MARLLETTFIRVGNEEYARSNKSFGLTTLKDRHVQIGPTKLRFRFRGKSGVEHEISVEDPIMTRIVRRCRDLPGQELFQYVDDDGSPATIDSADVNDYIREAAGDDFTAKDFRTWAGTVLAATALGQLWAVRGAAAAGRAARPTNRDVARAISDVAAAPGQHRWRSAESVTSIPRSSRRTSTDRCPPPSPRERTSARRARPLACAPTRPPSSGCSSGTKRMIDAAPRSRASSVVRCASFAAAKRAAPDRGYRDGAQRIGRDVRPRAAPGRLRVGSRAGLALPSSAARSPWASAALWPDALSASSRMVLDSASRTSG